MKRDEPTTIIDCPTPLEISLHIKREEEELPDAGDPYPRPERSLGLTPSLDRAGVRVPTQRYYYAEPPGGTRFTDQDLQVVAEPLRRSGITGFGLGLFARVSDQGVLSLG